MREEASVVERLLETVRRWFDRWVSSPAGSLLLKITAGLVVTGGLLVWLGRRLGAEEGESLADEILDGPDEQPESVGRVEEEAEGAARRREESIEAVNAGGEAVAEEVDGEWEDGDEPYLS